MSKYIDTVNVEKTEDIGRLLELTETLSEHTEQMKEMILLMDTLQKSGIITLLRAVLENLDAVLMTLSEELLRDSNARFIRNASSAYAFLSKIDPEKLDKITSTFANSLNSFGSVGDNSPVGILTLMQFLKDPDVSAGIRLIFQMLKGLGAAGKS